jgi:hypothetical protein
VNPDRRESDLQPIPQDVQQLWSGNNARGVPAETIVLDDVKYRRVNLWWYVMLLALVVALAESTLASRYMSTQREEA